MTSRIASRMAARLALAAASVLAALVLVPALAGAWPSTTLAPVRDTLGLAPPPDSAAMAVADSIAAVQADSNAAATRRLRAALPRKIHLLAQQMSDETIGGDLAAIDNWRTYLDRMDRSQMDLWRTALSKAWLDAARSEYIDNDRTGFPQNAFLRAVNLIAEIERGVDPAGFQNVAPAVPPKGSRRFLDSLYFQLEEMKHDPGFLCAASELARMEVELGWAGNESIDQGDCMTSPHVATARELSLAARRKVDTCGPPLLAVRREPPAPPPIELPVPVPAPTAILPTVEELRIPRNVHFALASSEVSYGSLSVINAIAALLDKYPSITVRLEGHADSRGDSVYNLDLSRQRVMATRAVFVALGVDSARIATSYRGKAALFAVEDSKRGFALNRRVEMVFVDDEGRDIKLERQEGDLQLEADRPAAIKRVISAATRRSAASGTRPAGTRAGSVVKPAGTRAKSAATSAAPAAKPKPAPAPAKPVATDSP